MEHVLLYLQWLLHFKNHAKKKKKEKNNNTHTHMQLSHPTTLHLQRHRCKVMQGCIPAVTIHTGPARYQPFTWVSYSAIISLSFLTLAWDDIFWRGRDGLCNQSSGRNQRVGGHNAATTSRPRFSSVSPASWPSHDQGETIGQFNTQLQSPATSTALRF